MFADKYTQQYDWLKTKVAMTRIRNAVKINKYVVSYK